MGFERKDFLEVTAEILKKARAPDTKKLANREKATAIGALRKMYPLNDLLKCLAMPKSSYFYHRAVLSMPDKYAELRGRVRTAFAAADGRYGYRRLHTVLTKDGQGCVRKYRTPAHACPEPGGRP